MMSVGIEKMNVYGGTAYLDVASLGRYRNLDATRFANLMMEEKTVPLPYEDPVTFGVNAAKPIIDALDEGEKSRIELLITCTESGIDFGKSISTYIHHHLGLSRNCRLFELKSACYSGTAGFQMAVSFILSQSAKGAKALVIATDIARFMAVNKGETLDWDMSFTEPSSGAGAVALLISDRPDIYQIDVGASGYYGYEVMDTCRPVPDCDAGDADLSLLSYLDCCEQSYKDYERRVEAVDYRRDFQYLAFHTPFGGMVKGAHRMMMRKFGKAAGQEIDEDFAARVKPGLAYCQRVGNIMGATVLLSLASTIDHGQFDRPKRIGSFSYGSGCCSEFYSGVVRKEGQLKLRQMDIARKLDNRSKLTIREYETILELSGSVKFGARNSIIPLGDMPVPPSSTQGDKRLVLEEIREFHREYTWI